MTFEQREYMNSDDCVNKEAYQEQMDKMESSQVEFYDDLESLTEFEVDACESLYL